MFHSATFSRTCQLHPHHSTTVTKCSSVDFTNAWLHSRGSAPAVQGGVRIKLNQKLIEKATSDVRRESTPHPRECCGSQQCRPLLRGRTLEDAQEREVDLGQLWQVCTCGWRELLREPRQSWQKVGAATRVCVIFKALLSLAVCLSSASLTPPPPPRL